MGRDVRGSLLCVAMIAVAIVDGGDARAAAAPAATPLPQDLYLRLTATSDLLPAARASLIHQAEDIWLRESVRLHWLAPAEPEPPGAPVLRVLVGHLLGRPEASEAWPVGQLQPPTPDGPRLAIASIAAARRVIAAAGHETDPPVLAEHRLGLVLGRAIAHEIGHYLLGTRDHAPRGLMRAQIDARDFSDLRDGRFFLDAVARRWLQEAPARGLAAHLAPAPRLH